MPMDWKTTDAAIAMLRRKAVRRFAQTIDGISDFDELNVTERGKTLYTALCKDNEQAFLDLAKHIYYETEPHGKKDPNKKWLLAFLAAYFAVTGYVYDHETDRKRAYFVEGVIADKHTKAALQRQAKKALRYWNDMTYEYADGVTDKARLKAFEDAGVKQVRWNALSDACEECQELNGEVFDIDDVPDKPHRHCRCWLTAV